MKRLAAANERAVESLAGIERAITVLGDEDILDFADIIRLMPDTVLNRMVQAEMDRRNIRL